MNYYNHTRKLFANQEVDLSTLKVMLVDSDYAFDATETDMTVAEMDEAYGNGWTQGGEAVASVAAGVDNTNEAILDAADLEKLATGGAIGPARGMIVFDSTGVDSGDWKPLFHYDFGGDKQAAETTYFRIVWPAEGIADFRAV